MAERISIVAVSIAAFLTAINQISFDVSRSVDSMLYKIAEAYLANTGLMDLAVDDDYE